MSACLFNAPWCRTLRWMSWGVGGFLFILPFLLIMGPGSAAGSGWIVGLGALVAWGILFGSALFTIRAYGLDRGEILIRRWFWTTRRSLHGLREARIDASALRGVWRVFGNGGLFSFSGWYWNRALGQQRWWVTDPELAVILEFGVRRWVISPEDPSAFVAELVAQGLVAGGGK